jgi:hypothetical protein
MKTLFSKKERVLLLKLITMSAAAADAIMMFLPLLKCTIHGANGASREGIYAYFYVRKNKLKA